MRFAAVIVAGGRGARAGGEIPKQYNWVAGRPVIGWSVSALVSAGASEIVIACAPEHAQLCRDATGDAHLVQLVDGGATMTASVRAGLAAIGDDVNSSL